MLPYKKTDSLNPLKKIGFFKPFQKIGSQMLRKFIETMKLNIQLITAAILSIGGLIMLFCGVFIEPDGQIHESLLVGFGEVVTFSGALFGIDYVYKQKK